MAPEHPESSLSNIQHQAIRALNQASYPPDTHLISSRQNTTFLNLDIAITLELDTDFALPTHIRTRSEGACEGDLNLRETAIETSMKCMAQLLAVSLTTTGSTSCSLPSIRLPLTQFAPPRSYRDQRPQTKVGSNPATRSSANDSVSKPTLSLLAIVPVDDRLQKPHLRESPS